ncbi:hypothetical protein V6Z11_D02G200800 [Gossypium hirsutum]
MFALCAYGAFHHVSSTVKLVPVSPYCPKRTSKNSVHLARMIVK